MNKSLRNILSLLLVLLTGASLNAVADSYNVAPMTAGKVTVSPNDEFVNAPINLINYGTNPVKQITYTIYCHHGIVGKTLSRRVHRHFNS